MSKHIIVSDLVSSLSVTFTYYNVILYVLILNQKIIYIIGYLHITYMSEIKDIDYWKGEEYCYLNPKRMNN